MIYNPDQAKVAGEIIHRLATDAKLKLEGYEAVVDMGQQVPDQLLQILSRSASCVVLLDEASSWDITALQRELRERVQQHSIRLIFLQLSERKIPDYVDTEVVNWDNENNWKDLEAAIVGYRQTVVNYPIDAEIPDELKLGSTISGTFLPPDTYTERPEQHQIREFWQDEQRNGVLSLIGIGGSGKTTLLLRFLETLPDHPLSNLEQVRQHNLNAPNSVFLWSFYDNPNIEYFIRGLYEHLTGEATSDAARDVTYRLIRYLDTNPVSRFLIALDGLEIIQEDRDSSGGFGLLRDSSLRHLVRRIAQGDLPIKMIITSRYPLPELQPFDISGYWSINTNKLDAGSAMKFLRERGLTGTDEELAALISEFGSHCLTLDHLARILTTYFSGNLDATKQFTIPENISDEAQAKQLARLLKIYEDQLSDEEMIVLRITCTLRKPISLKLIESILSSPEGLSSQNESWQVDSTTIRRTLAKLQKLNLVLFYKMRHETVCTTHSAIRDYFAIYREKGAINLHTVTKNALITSAKSDSPDASIRGQDLFYNLFEEVIFHSLESEQVSDAITWYSALGGFRGMGWKSGNFERGLRNARLLVEKMGEQAVDVFEAIPHERNLFLLDLGYSEVAERNTQQLIEYCRELNKESNESDEYELKFQNPFGYSEERSYAMYEAILLQTLADAKLVQGKLVETLELLDEMLSTERIWDVSGRPRTSGSNPFGRRAITHFLLGYINKAIEDFIGADDFAAKYTPRTLFPTQNWYHKAFHARLLARLGKLYAARKRLESIKVEQMRAHRPLSISQYDLTAAEIAYLSGDQVTAMKHIETALAWSMQSGHQHIYAQSQIQLARQHLLAQHHENATEALSEAIKTSRQSNFNLQLADALVLSGHLALEGNSSDEAEEYGTEALDISERLSYRWGSGDAAYLLAKAQHLKGNSNNALEYAQKSLDVRQFIQDPRAKHTHKLIQSIQSN